MRIYPIVLLGIILHLASQGIFSQSPIEPQPKKVFWDENAACGIKNSAVTATDNFKCTLVVQADGKKYHRVDHNGLELSVSFYISDRYLAAETLLVNRSDKPKTFESKDWTVINFKNVNAFMAGEKPISGSGSVQKPVAFLTSNNARVSTDDRDREFIADVNKTAATRDEKGVIRRDNPTPPALSSAKVHPTRPLAVITETLIPAEKEVSGNVYFLYDSVAGFRFVTMIVDGVYYIFPVFK